MSQFDEVSNIANPTFDAELAISMTVNAKLPKTPQSPAAGASDLAVDSLDNNIPTGRARNRAALPAQIPRSNGEQRAKFQGAAVQKADPAAEGRCPKNELQDIQTSPVCPGRHLIAVCARQFQCTPCSWLLISAKRAATNSTNFASVWQLSKQNSTQRCREKKPFLARCRVRKSAKAVYAHGRSEA